MPKPIPPKASPGLSGQSVLAAQVLGQGDRKRGLKGGAPLIEAARSSYLETEWSGPADRRTRTGRITRTEV